MRRALGGQSGYGAAQRLKVLASELSSARNAAARRSGANSGSGNLYTLAQLQTAGRETAQRLKDVAQELVDLSDRIPLVVRAIWGRHSETVVDALKQQQQLAARLIRQWEMAEHRLIAVANSLSVSASGQKLLAVGIPLAASELLRSSSSTAYAYHSPMMMREAQPVASLGLTLGELQARVAKLASAMAEEARIALRGLYLFLLFLPAVLTSPVLMLGGGWEARREQWLELMRWTLERAGPAFIKWGQWAATRPDMFPADVCAQLALLQTKAPTHSYEHTHAAVEEAFGRPLGELFAAFETEPVASGSIAQVHRAVLSEQGARLAARQPQPKGLPALPFRRKDDGLFGPGATVAVKVRHPGVTTLMVRDFAIMQRCALLLAALPVVGNPQLKDSLMQFGAPLKEQLDLKVEADNLNRFTTNFRYWNGVAFPKPAGAPLVSSDVLVETFEEGELITKYMHDAPGRYNKKLAELGSSCYLKMLLKDNFIHADLHPGNILVRLEEPAPPGSLRGALARLLGVGPAPRLVLLDVGMIARLTNDDQSNLVDFFKSITDLDGAAVADSIMAFSEDGARCADPARFRADMDSLFTGMDHDYLRTNTTQVVAEMMDTIRRHQVPLKGVISTVVISTVVLEGWSTKLDPDIRIMESLKEVLPSSWTDRISKTVDRMMSTKSPLALTV